MNKEIWSPRVDDIVVGAQVKTNLTKHLLTVEIPTTKVVHIPEPTEEDPEATRDVTVPAFYHPQHGLISDMGHRLRSKQAFKATREEPLSKAELKSNKDKSKKLQDKLSKLQEKLSNFDEKKDVQEINRTNSQIEGLEGYIETLGKKIKTVAYYPTLNNIFYLIPPKKSKNTKK